MITWLSEFVHESNRIEGILREPMRDEIEAHEFFLEREKIDVMHLIDLVAVLQPDADLRDRPGVPGVRVGSHIAPPSGPAIRERLEKQILPLAILSDSRPFDVHRMYETLHPFTDGNGRSGRALWLWMMLQAGDHQAAMAHQLGFLHSWYYQSLEASRP